jgi:2-amino-4-hydroxy-6-hydroxymethyldihydropteridine diphosphokinase
MLSKFLLRSDLPVIAFIAIGSNLGDSKGFVNKAIHELSTANGVKLINQSPLYRSKPYQAIGEDYVNAVIKVETLLNAEDLLQLMLCIELEHGRLRSSVNAPRTLDLDLIFFGSSTIDSPRLKVPHPRWQERAFVLLPLKFIASELVTDEMLEKVQVQEINLIE